MDVKRDPGVVRGCFRCKAIGHNKQENGVSEITPASDVFSLGAMMDQLYKGQLPFHGESFLGLLEGITHHESKGLQALRFAPPPIWYELHEMSPQRTTPVLSEYW